MIKRSVITFAAVVATLAAPANVALAGFGPPAPSFFVNGTAYRTVATPTDLSGTGAPESSFDTIYDFGGEQMNVATAAPGDAGYNGGRWIVLGLVWRTTYEDAVAQHGGTADPMVIDTNAEIAAVRADPDAGGATTVEVTRFVCPVIEPAG